MIQEIRQTHERGPWEGTKRSGYPGVGAIALMGRADYPKKGGSQACPLELSGSLVSLWARKRIKANQRYASRLR